MLCLLFNKEKKKKGKKMKKLLFILNKKQISNQSLRLNRKELKMKKKSKFKN